MGHVSVDLQAVRMARQATQDKREQLNANLQKMEMVNEKVLAGWDDDHVKQYMAVMDLIHATLLRVLTRMNDVEEFCDEEERWILTYLNT